MPDITLVWYFLRTMVHGGDQHRHLHARECASFTISPPEVQARFFIREKQGGLWNAEMVESETAKILAVFGASQLAAAQAVERGKLAGRRSLGHFLPSRTKR